KQVTNNGITIFLSFMITDPCEAFPVTVVYDFLLTQYRCIKYAVKTGSNMETANREPVLKSYLPVIVMYASVDNTEKSPSIIMGLPKSSSDLINVNSSELKTPGNANGRVMVENTFHLDAPRLRAESSNDASMDSSTPFKLRYAIGEKDIA